MREQRTIEAYSVNRKQSISSEIISHHLLQPASSYHWVFGHLLSPTAGRLTPALPWKLLLFQQLMRSAEGQRHILFGPIFGTGSSHPVCLIKYHPPTCHACYYNIQFLPCFNLIQRLCYWGLKNTSFDGKVLIIHSAAILLVFTFSA